MLTAETGGRWLEISVIDSGEGISAEDLPHVWERFYRGGHGGGAAGRTGIGLSLVKDLVEAMDGSVGVESRQGADAGSRFWLRLHAQTGPA
jgi:signal transduction histidine kinase